MHPRISDNLGQARQTVAPACRAAAQGIAASHRIINKISLDHHHQVGYYFLAGGK
jgi:hypothetical protein